MTALIDFDTLKSRRDPDFHARLIDVSVTPVDHQHIRLSFTIPQDITPLAVYARLVEQRPWSLSRSVGASVVAQLENKLVPGPNTILINRNTGPLSDLLGLTETGVDYILVIAISADGRAWGPISESAFTMPAPPAGARDILRPILVD
jgi:hypothetical protein